MLHLLSDDDAIVSLSCDATHQQVQNVFTLLRCSEAVLGLHVNLSERVMVAAALRNVLC